MPQILSANKNNNTKRNNENEEKQNQNQQQLHGKKMLSFSYVNKL